MARVRTRDGAGSAVCVYATDGVGMALSARHLYDAKMRRVPVVRVAAKVVFEGGKSYDVTDVIEHPTADLCGMVFSYSGAAPPTVYLDHAVPAARSKVWKVGYPGGGRLDVRSGEAVGLDRLGLAYTSLTRPGDSGGGLFSSDGYLIGILIIAETDARNAFVQGFAVPPRTCYDFFYKTCLPRLRGGRPPARPQPQVPSPPTPSGPPPGGSSDLLAELRARVERLEADCRRPGERGPAGAKGDRGPCGPPGPAGKDADESRVASLERELAALRLLIERAGARPAETRVRVVPAKR